MQAADVLKLIKDKGIKFVDYRFTDFPGTQQHTTVPANMVDEGTFENGHGFDASSIRGWAEINNSDMLIVPDPSTAQIDPFFEHPTLSLVCDVVDPITREAYGRDPRGVARRAEAYLKSSGLGDTCYIGPELEFFLFNEARYDYKNNSSMHVIDSIEAFWNSGKDEREEYGRPNLGAKIANKGGYFPVPPTDSLHDIRSEMVTLMNEAGLNIECHHHEVATAGQCEIDMKFDSLLTMADKAMTYKYIVKNVAARHGLTACFMPKPIYGDNGSGMHTHISIWKGGTNLFAGNGYAGLSEAGLYFIGGIMKHARAIIAFSNPTTNSYRRLVPGYEAPVNIAYSARNRSACIRIPMLSTSPKAKRVEFRCPDPAANPYFSFPALLMAGLDGIQNKIHPGDPLDKNIYDLPAEIAKTVPKAPYSLDEALSALEEDHEFLLKGGVFTEDIIQNHIEYKLKNEVDAIRLRPHPYEFMMYYDC
ncbi:MAG: type I glutamate--ammonia ligase [Candidatus Sumerlaeia bacterium]|nr:type I glutamate--ammonia ligase [Candidatus Sumerlaeia bacterium]